MPHPYTNNINYLANNDFMIDFEAYDILFRKHYDIKVTYFAQILVWLKKKILLL